jgi:hypothetical protein
MALMIDYGLTANYPLLLSKNPKYGYKTKNFFLIDEIFSYFIISFDT